MCRVVKCDKNNLPSIVFWAFMATISLSRKRKQEIVWPRQKKGPLVLKRKVKGGSRASQKPTAQSPRSFFIIHNSLVNVISEGHFLYLMFIFLLQCPPPSGRTHQMVITWWRKAEKWNWNVWLQAIQIPLSFGPDRYNESLSLGPTNDLSNLFKYE